MTNSEILKAAHKEAKKGNTNFPYRNRLACALRTVWAYAKDLKIVKIRKISLWTKSDRRLYVDYKMNGKWENGCFFISNGTSKNLPTSILDAAKSICNRVKGRDFSTVYENQM